MSKRHPVMIKAWPHDRENHTKLCDDFRKLSSRYDQPHTRRMKHIINSS